MTRHHLFNPAGMLPASGFSYGAVPSEGKTVYLAGLTGHAADGSIEETLVDQFRAACEAVVKVVAEAGGSPSDVVSMTIYCTDIGGYRDQTKAIGREYRAVFGTHYPAMALFGISELFDPRAKVELVCVAVVPA